MAVRLTKAWRALSPDQRLAALAAFGLFVTMFLPWYTKDTTAVVKGRLDTVDDTLIAWQAFSFVEAAVLLVAVWVLVLLFARGEGRAFHLPGGDGAVLTAAGLWVCLLVFIRQLDQPDGQKTNEFTTDYGVTWGIFLTFLAGALLAYAGWRVRQAHLVEPPLPDERPPQAPPPARRPRIDGGTQLTFDEHE